LPSRSLKEVFFPPTEPLLSWRLKGTDVEIEETPTTFPKTVVIGAFPCDAAAVEALDRVMGWDYRDELWFGRREATTIVSVACAGIDEACLCSAVGLGPDSGRGSDMLLVPVKGGFQAEALTDKGEALITEHEERFAKPKDEHAKAAEEFRSRARTKVEANASVTPVQIQEWLKAHFEDPLWDGVALRCHGCGACAFVCPTCHCFDIVDEPDGIDHGVRRRNWDTCQTARFTVHGSGHNPRPNQRARFRQRMMHKFSIYPERFGGTVLCTGCGRCARKCSGGMDLIELLRIIESNAAAAAKTGGAP
jgi:ferredoxin